MNIDLRGAFWTPSATILGSASKMYERVVRSIFANGEQGFAYDPNDLTTLFQDAAGTIPVTSTGQPVALVLDKSKGLVLGDELIIGGSFEDGLIGTKSEGSGSVSTWELNTTGTISGTKDGKLTITTASANRPTLRFPVVSNPVMGKTYRLSFNYKVTSGVAIISQLNNGSSATLVVNKTLTGSGTFAATVSWQGESTVQPYIYFGESIATIQIDNVSFKELTGNHAYQTVSASRPILRQTPILGNELATNGNFSNGLEGWAASNAAIITNVNNSLRVTSTDVANAQARQAGTAAAGKTVECSVNFKSKTGSSSYVRLALYSVATGNVGVADSRISVTSGTLTFTAQVPSNFAGNLVLQLGGAASGESVDFDDVTIKEITGYRADQNYLEFDGVDDFVQTNNIDFTATDKVSLFAGVRKLSDAATAVVAELGTDSITVNGTFGLFAPAGTGVTKFQFLSRGATGTNYAQALNAIYNAPISAVVRGIGSIADQNSELHVNRALAGKSPTGLTGAGNYSASPLYIGRRAGLSLPFSGNLYGLIGVGRLTTDGETLAVERELAKQTGVVLNV